MESSDEIAPSFDYLLPSPTLDIGRVRALCDQFISQMENRRSNRDDAGVARLVILELEAYGRLTKDTYKRLARWCHSGSSYTEGIDPARRISEAIYGRIVSESDITKDRRTEWSRRSQGSANKSSR